MGADQKQAYKLAEERRRELEEEDEDSTEWRISALQQHNPREGRTVTFHGGAPPCRMQAVDAMVARQRLSAFGGL